MAEIVNYGNKQTAALQITTGLYPSTASPLDIRESVASLDILSQPVPVGCSLYPGLRIFVEDPPQTVTVLGKLTGADGSLWSHWIFDTILPAFKDAIDGSQSETRYQGIGKPRDYTPENLLNYLFIMCSDTNIAFHKITVTYLGLGESIVRQYAYQENKPYVIFPEIFEGYVASPTELSGIMGSEDITANFTYTQASYVLRYYKTSSKTELIQEYPAVPYHSVISGQYTPADPTLEGNTFSGWEYHPNLEEGRMPAEDVDAIGLWTPIPVEYEITTAAYSSSGGTVTGGGTYQQGQSCTVTATANEGYTFTNWTENGNVVSTNDNYTFTVTGNRNLVANFTLNTYTVSITTEPSEGGTASGAGTYNYGDQCELSATPNTGYTFINWTEDGHVISHRQDPTINSVIRNYNLVANFTVSTYTITASANPTNGGTVSGAGTFNHGASCTLTATANNGFVFESWTENGSSVSTNSSYSFSVTSDRTLVANFRAAESYDVYGFPMSTAELYNGGSSPDISNISFSGKPSYSSNVTDGIYKVSVAAGSSDSTRNLVAAIPTVLLSGNDFDIASAGMNDELVPTSIQGFSGNVTIGGNQYIVKVSTPFSTDNSKELIFGDYSQYSNWPQAWSAATAIPQPSSGNSNS